MNRKTKSTLSEYRAWQNLKQRCLNPKDKDYPYYGGRGIRVCKRWATSFENFYADMGAKPNNTYSLDRIDNDGDYDPNNCRWADKITQSINRRYSRFIRYGNQTLCLREWANVLGITYKCLWNRIVRDRWTIESAFTTPTRKRYRE